METLLSALADVLGPQGVLQGEAVRARRATYWNAGPMQARAILRPATVEQVQACLRLCHQARQPLVPLGGNTGLVEGTACGADQLLLSLERLNGIERVDPVSQTVTVQAGVILQVLQERLAASHWRVPVDLGARGSCTLGGMMATNAGGFGVLAHGMMRAQVLGLEVVLADGSLLSSMRGFMKDNTGYDLKQLFIGSEGTLGVITRAVLRMTPLPGGHATALVGVSRFEQVTGLLAAMQRSMEGQLSAFEVMWPGFWALNTGPESGLRPPLSGHGHYVLLEAEGSTQERARDCCERALEQAFEAGLVEDAVLAGSEAERRHLWAIREACEVEQRRFVRTQGFDVSLAIAHMQDFVESLQQRLHVLQADAGLLVFGHLADGNLHVTVGLQEPAPSVHRVECLVYDTLAEFHGSISAEHGIGVEKKPWLSRSRNEEERRWMARLKQLFDPFNLLNPGKLIDP